MTWMRCLTTKTIRVEGNVTYMPREYRFTAVVELSRPRWKLPLAEWTEARLVQVRDRETGTELPLLGLPMILEKNASEDIEKLFLENESRPSRAHRRMERLVLKIIVVVVLWGAVVLGLLGVNQ
jgi:cell division septal protein FtsQ